MSTTTISIVSLIVGLVVAGFTLGIVFIVASRSASIAKSRLNKGMDPRVVLYKLYRFIKYFHWCTFIPLVLISLLIVIFNVRFIRPHLLGYFVGALIESILYALLKTMYNIPVYDVEQKVRPTSSSLGATLFRRAIQPFATALVYCLWVESSLILGVNWQYAHPVLSTLYVMTTFAAIFFAGSWMVRRVLKSTVLPEDQVPARWREFVSASELSSVEFHIWHTKKWRIANAMAIGLGKNRVYISDYLLEHLTDPEAEAVVSHELGHLHKRHLWFMFIYAEAWFPVVAILISVMTHFHMNGGLMLFLELLLLAVYQGLVFHWLSRRFEYQADAHAKMLMGGPSEMVCALEKLSDLGFSLKDIPKFDELWLTHPSMMHRIQHLQRTIQGTKTRVID